MVGVCRTCMSSNKPVKSLFEVDEDLIELHVKLYTCFPTFNFDDSDFPKTMCGPCIKMMRIAYKFRELCIKSTGAFLKKRKNKKVNTATKTEALKPNKELNAETLKPNTELNTETLKPNTELNTETLKSNTELNTEALKPNTELNTENEQTMPNLISTKATINNSPDISDQIDSPNKLSIPDTIELHFSEFPTNNSNIVSENISGDNEKNITPQSVSVDLASNKISENTTTDSINAASFVNDKINSVQTDDSFESQSISVEKEILDGHSKKGKHTIIDLNSKLNESEEEIPMQAPSVLNMNITQNQNDINLNSLDIVVKRTFVIENQEKYLINTNTEENDLVYRINLIAGDESSSLIHTNKSDNLKKSAITKPNGDLNKDTTEQNAEEVTCPENENQSKQPTELINANNDKTRSEREINIRKCLTKYFRRILTNRCSIPNANLNVENKEDLNKKCSKNNTVTENETRLENMNFTEEDDSFENETSLLKPLENFELNNFINSTLIYDEMMYNEENNIEETEHTQNNDYIEEHIEFQDEIVVISNLTNPSEKDNNLINAICKANNIHENNLEVTPNEIELSTNFMKENVNPISELSIGSLKALNEQCSQDNINTTEVRNFRDVETNLAKSLVNDKSAPLITPIPIAKLMSNTGVQNNKPQPDEIDDLVNKNVTYDFSNHNDHNYAKMLYDEESDTSYSSDNTTSKRRISLRLKGAKDFKFQTPPSKGYKHLKLQSPPSKVCNNLKLRSSASKVSNDFKLQSPPLKESKDFKLQPLPSKVSKKIKMKSQASKVSKDFKLQSPPLKVSKDFKLQSPPLKVSKDFKLQSPPLKVSKNLKLKSPASKVSKDFKLQSPPSKDSKDFKLQSPPSNESKDFKLQSPPSKVSKDFKLQSPPSNVSKDFKLQSPASNVSKDFKLQSPPSEVKPIITKRKRRNKSPLLSAKKRRRRTKTADKGAEDLTKETSSSNLVRNPNVSITETDSSSNLVQTSEVSLTKPDISSNLVQNSDISIMKTDSSSNLVQNPEVSITKTDTSSNLVQNSDISITKTDASSNLVQNSDVSLIKTDIASNLVQNSDVSVTKTDTSSNLTQTSDVSLTKTESSSDLTQTSDVSFTKTESSSDLAQTSDVSLTKTDTSLNLAQTSDVSLTKTESSSNLAQTSDVSLTKTDTSLNLAQTSDVSLTKTDTSPNLAQTPDVSSKSITKKTRARRSYGNRRKSAPAAAETEVVDSPTIINKKAEWRVKRVRSRKNSIDPIKLKIQNIAIDTKIPPKVNKTSNKRTPSKDKAETIESTPIREDETEAEEVLTKKAKIESNKNIQENKETPPFSMKETPVPTSSSTEDFTSMKLNEVVNDMDPECAYSCDLCILRFKSLFDLQKHLSTHLNVGVGPKLICEYCQRLFVNNTGLKTHIRRIHKNQNNPDPNLDRQVNSFPCGVCQKNFPTKSSLSTHKKIHTF